MPKYDLSEEQWCLLDLLVRARQKGIPAVSRMELLHNTTMPQGLSVKLTWAALTMPQEIVRLEGQHDFVITDEGVSLFNLRFGTKDKAAQPTAVADAVIYLPGPSGYSSN